MDLTHICVVTEKAKRVNRAHSETQCNFRPADADFEVIASYSEETQQFEEPQDSSEVINFGQYVDQVCITKHKNETRQCC